MDSVDKYYDLMDKFIADMNKQRNDAKIKAFVKDIGEMLRKNGVVPYLGEYKNEQSTEKTYSVEYGYVLEELDFTEHDKPFEKRIKLLQEENRKLYNQLMETEKDYQEEVERLSRKIDDYVESETMLIVENKELKRHLSDLKSKKAEENILSMTIICTEKINGQDYVRLEDFMSVVNDLQAQISTLKS